MKAALLVGGVGTRLRPLTYLVPKPMLPLAGRPLLERSLDYLKQYGFQDVVLCVAYLKKQIIDYFGNGTKFGIRIEYAESDEPLGTAGQLRTAKPYLEDEKTFLAMNGDIFTSLELDKMRDFHVSRKAFLTIALKLYEFKMPYGRVTLSEDDTITEFAEKPSISFFANAGVYLCDAGIFEYFPSTDPSNLEYDVFPAVIKNGKKVSGYRSDAEWGDIGKLSDYEKLNGEAMTNGFKILGKQ